MPDSDDNRRRQDDIVLEQVRGELALLRQATELGSKTNDARFDGLARSIDVLSGKLEQVIAGQTEAGASPAGRRILEVLAVHDKSIADHEKAIDDFDAFRSEVRGGLKALRAQLAIGGFILGVVSGITAVVTIINGTPT